MFGFSWLKIGLGLGALILIGLAAFAIKAGINKIEAQGKQIANLERNLEAEKQARQRDVAGLTTLARGITAAATARGLDEEVLRNEIDTRNPNPVSPELARFLDGLRRSDRATRAAPAAGGAGGRPPARAPNPRSGSR